MTPSSNPRDGLTGKILLVTGGTGSFGHSFVRHVMGRDFAELRVFSRDELKQSEMRAAFDDPRIKFYIGDVRDRDSVDQAMVGVDHVFHAAALKQVPTCEFFPLQAVLTNILGSHNVIESAIEAGVARLIWLSTDKAVYPVNAMGATKALMEKVGQAASRRLSGGATLIAGVRYGNVMCSRGSVIPLFLEQLRQNRPLTLTVPEMTRFLLPLRDAIELVELAFERAGQGDVFVKKAPACTIGDLARALCRLFGREEEFEIVGMRHGEKLHETLVSREELAHTEDLGDYYRIRPDTRDLNYKLYFTEGETRSAELEDYTSHNTRRLSAEEVEELLFTLPEIDVALTEARRQPT